MKRIHLAAYVGQSNHRWLLLWTVVGCLSTFIYTCQVKAPPYAFFNPYTPFFNTVLTVLNLLLLAFICRMLIRRSHLSRHYLSTKSNLRIVSRTGRNYETKQ